MNEFNTDKKKDKVFTIIVNAQQKTVDHKRLTFEEIVILAFGAYQPSDTIIYTVLYTRGEHGKEGSLVAGDSINVKDGMELNVDKNNRS
jgi:hypothetical protein